MFRYEWWWLLMNRIRKFFGHPAQPKRCCRNPLNLGPAVQERPDLSYRRCLICSCRHFESVIDPGKFGIVAR